jgi:hypothetical protein
MLRPEHPDLTLYPQSFAELHPTFLKIGSLTELPDHRLNGIKF